MKNTFLIAIYVVSFVECFGQIDSTSKSFIDAKKFLSDREVTLDILEKSDESISNAKHISIQLSHSNWYTVKCDCEKGQQINRIIHVHRVKKFIRKYNELKFESSHSATCPCRETQFIFMNATSEVIHTMKISTRAMEKLYHVLKIWK